jgi:hypothetical protein
MDKRFIRGLDVMRIEGGRGKVVGIYVEGSYFIGLEIGLGKALCGI